MNILMILTSHDEMGDTGEKTGLWLEEFAAPYYVFKDAGATITLASPKGGAAPIDPRSETDDAQTEDTKRYYEDDAAKDALSNTVKLSEIQPDEYHAVFLPGGHGPMFDLARDEESKRVIQAFQIGGRPIGAVCHAPAALLQAQDMDGRAMLSGSKVTGFSNAEEEAVGLTDAVPFLLEDALKQVGGTYEKGENFEPYVVTDRMLVTGQNPASSAPTAKALLELMG
ncbi:type 1 glutamine amidotransferase domain-containing protein [Cognatishimia sp. MH4019]|uniref:type 1 glutamine amidotransferase domain-containing protein n=1 Tax=Cognatishimia sp. MH4019 TaxID=2854030 RepID=UPI001CD68786|nr:type 1 glutamine amidotransferase domain-containing protein [Cognatishimia sp. MH4019]